MSLSAGTEHPKKIRQMLCNAADMGGVRGTGRKKNLYADKVQNGSHAGPSRESERTDQAQKCGRADQAQDYGHAGDAQNDRYAGQAKKGRPVVDAQKTD